MGTTPQPGNYFCFLIFCNWGRRRIPSC
jgi:hypothetical protein